MIRFERYTRYTVTLPQGEISPSGSNQLLEFIYAQSMQADEWKALNPAPTVSFLPVLPHDWSWSWVVQRGEYVGTLPKRIRSFYFKQHGIKCPDSFIEQIGNIARQHSDSQSVYSFEIVDRFEWEAGDFGDSGSCYWGGNAGARIMLNDNGGMAVCFFTDSGHGYARSWFVEIDSDLFVIFNGYGFGRGMNATLTIARVLASFFTLSYKKIDLDNSYGNTLYINNGIGYIIGTPETIQDIDSWDFEWVDIEAHVCYSCGTIIDEHDIYTGADDNDYCSDCFYQYFDRCESCDETYNSDDMEYIESLGCSICRYCRARDYDVCHSCDEWFENDELHTHDDELYCWQCLNDETSPPDFAE